MANTAKQLGFLAAAGLLALGTLTLGTRTSSAQNGSYQPAPPPPADQSAYPQSYPQPGDQPNNPQAKPPAYPPPSSYPQSGYPQQGYPQQGNAYPQAGSQPAPMPQDSLNWVPQGMMVLAQQASWHTDFTFDRSMLALAGNLYGLDEPTRQSLGRLNGISVHSYRFPAPGAYDPAALEAVRAQYNALGWKHVVTAKSHPGAPGYAAGQTDLWIDTKGVNVAGAAILLAGPSNLNLIAVSGDLSTMDLLHLRGHFGIPRFSDNALPPMH